VFQEEEIPSKENLNSSNTKGVWNPGNSANSLGLSVSMQPRFSSEFGTNQGMVEDSGNNM
jgi:hypothetical protein